MPGGHNHPPGGHSPQPGGYRPPQGGYTPQPGGYSPPQGSHNHQHGSYNPHQGGYTPQPGDRDPQKGRYNPQQGNYNPPPGRNPQGGYTPQPGGYTSSRDDYNPRPGGYHPSGSHNSEWHRDHGVPNAGGDRDAYAPPTTPSYPATTTCAPDTDDFDLDPDLDIRSGGVDLESGSSNWINVLERTKNSSRPQSGQMVGCGDCRARRVSKELTGEVTLRFYDFRCASAVGRRHWRGTWR